MRKPAAASVLHAKNRYQCHFCTYVSTVVAHIRQHVMSKHLSYKPYSCAFCSFRAIRQCSVLSHVRYKHHASRTEQNICHFNPDDTLETEVNSGYHSVLVDELVERDLPRLQDHNYNAITSVAINACHNNSEGIQPGGTNSPGKGALKITLFPKKKRPYSIQNQLKFYRCRHCTFLTSNRQYLYSHMSKKHKTLELKCGYCDASKLNHSDMFIHWYKNHEDSPFRYHKVVCNGTRVEVNVSAAKVRTMVDRYLGTLAKLDNNRPTVSSMKVSSSVAGMDSAAENAAAAVDDIIFCCETCPSSFSTAEALSYHKCTASTH